MNKEKILADFTADFKKAKGAIEEILEHNRAIDGFLVEDLTQGDYNKLEEHIEISKIILDGIKSFNDLYKNAPAVLESIDKLPGDDKKKTGTSLEDVMKKLED